MNTFPLENIPQPPKDNRPVATFVILLIIAGCCLCMAFLCGCQHFPKLPTNGPDLGSAIGRNKSISAGIGGAQSDSKEIKKSVGRMQGSNASLKQNTADVLDGLDRADYKIQKLLQK